MSFLITGEWEVEPICLFYGKLYLVLNTLFCKKRDADFIITLKKCLKNYKTCYTILTLFFLRGCIPGFILIVVLSYKPKQPGVIQPTSFLHMKIILNWQNKFL